MYIVMFVSLEKTGLVYDKDIAVHSNIFVLPLLCQYITLYVFKCVCTSFEVLPNNVIIILFFLIPTYGEP